MKRLFPSPTIGLALAILCSFAEPLLAESSLAPIFADHMVIQREQPIQVWGTAPPGTQIEVVLAEQKTTGTTDDAGRWNLQLEPLPASGPFTLEVKIGTETKSFADVMIGDVWLASGQSNMVLALQATTQWPEVKKMGTFPDIRICKVPATSSFSPLEKYSRELRWDPLNSAKAGFFSGVGYHFARTVQPAIGVTLGVIQASAGGTQAEQWTLEADLKEAIPDNPLFAERDKAKAKHEADPSAKVNIMKTGVAGIYNATIHPLRFLKLAGVLWYQGEANSRSKRDYRPVLTTMIKSWRKLFGEPDLPFVIVQLPNFGLPKDDGWMRVQEAQALVAEDLDLALVVTVDLGSATTIHPPNKAEVGRRAGLAALQHFYKQEVEGSSPAVKEVQFENNSVLVEFDGFQGDLVLRGESVAGFELAGSNGDFQPATAQIQGRQVVVTSKGISEPTEVRYLWENSPEAVTIYSPAGLPAGPFRASRKAN